MTDMLMSSRKRLVISAAAVAASVMLVVGCGADQGKFECDGPVGVYKGRDSRGDNFTVRLPEYRACEK